MQRYFIPSHQISEKQCFFTDQDAHHIVKVMRYQPGDQVVGSDGLGRTFLVRLKEIEKDQVSGEILHDLDEERELPIRVTVAQGLPKGDKLEWVLQKGTELGAHHFIPFYSSRTIVKYDEKKATKKTERWKKIIKEAAEQSHRNKLPQIESIYSFEQLSNVKADLKLVAYEKEAQGINEKPTLLARELQKLQPNQSLLVVIGPEGGFDEQEMNTLEQKGFYRISLGSRILRTETASQYVLAAISYHFEQMGG